MHFPETYNKKYEMNKIGTNRTTFLGSEKYIK